MNTSITRVDFGDKIYIYLKSNDILTIPYSYTKKIQYAKIKKKVSGTFLLSTTINLKSAIIFNKL
ncbi:hypothetical protein [Sulfurimonas denitrificans]|uniref:hypothetical protein n=1 Tax=Sulfurimonas denitrificans TaxID=39766 RepID=UPI0002FFDD99|nr:hypothetical protein [Sulfurimonas denitrificans]MDD3442021.1 hypothetical protein [Sulfurimonas denitrificans]